MEKGELFLPGTKSFSMACPPAALFLSKIPEKRYLSQNETPQVRQGKRNDTPPTVCLWENRHKSILSLSQICDTSEK